MNRYTIGESPVFFPAWDGITVHHILGSPLLYGTTPECSDGTIADGQTRHFTAGHYLRSESSTRFVVEPDTQEAGVGPKGDKGDPGDPGPPGGPGPPGEPTDTSPFAVKPVTQAQSSVGTGSTQLAGGDDARFPTTGQKNALAGTSGTPGTTNAYVTTQDSRLTDARAPTSHTHDDRYYTEAEVDTALAGKSDAGHTHPGGGLPTLSLTQDATAVVGTAYADAAVGLNLAVTSGNAVRFHYFIAWAVNAATTGARFSLNGPAFTRLSYMVRWNTTATAVTTVLGNAYNQAFTVGTAADATNNLAIIEGIIVPSANGTLALRSSAEVASPGSVTVKAGSSLLHW